MMYLKLKNLLVTFLFTSIQICNATDYYVATNGNDGNDGTISNPLLTFAKGVSMLKNAGDNLYLRGGIYRGGATISRTATIDNPITISAYNNENVTIKGSKIISDWTVYSGNIYKKTEWNYESQQVFVNGVPLQQTGRVAAPIAGVAADGFWRIEDPNDPNSPYAMTLDDLDDAGNDGNFFYDKNNQILYIRLVDDANPDEHIIEASTEGKVLNAFGSTYLNIKNLKFMHNNVSVIKAGGGLIELGDYCTVENCDIQWGDQAGIESGYHKTGSKIINCILNNNGNSGITASATYNLLVTGCTMNNNNYRKFNILWHSGGIKMVSDSWGIVENNEVANNYGSGIWFDYCNDENHSIIRGNYIHDNGPKHAGIFLEVSNNIQVYNNIIDHNSRIGIAIEASEYIDVYNNDIMNTYFPGATGVAGVRIQRTPPTGMTMSNNYIYNNVFYNNGITCLSDIDIQVDDVANRVEKNYADYNIYYNSNGTYKLKYGSTTSSIETWQSWRFDTNGLIDNPDYIVGTGGDIKKSATNPTIDKGITKDFITTDYYGSARPQGTSSDIGAFEIGGEVGNIAPTANAGSNQTIIDEDNDGNETVILDGSSSLDSDGSIVSYLWKEGAVEIATGEKPSVSLSTGTHTIVLTVTDNEGATGTSTVTIIIKEPIDPSNGELLLYWDFNEGSGTVATDKSNNNNNGDFKGDATWATPGHDGTGSCLQVFATGEYGDNVRKTSPTSTSPDVHSIMAWFFVDPSTQWASGISKNDSWSLRAMEGSDANLVKWKADYTDVDGVFHNVTTTDEILVNEWHHIVATYDATTIKIYIDGTLSIEKTDAGFTLRDGDHIRAGYAGGRNFTGKIDEVKWYNKALTSTEVLEEYNGNSNPVNISPIANAGSDQTITDSNNNGIETVSLDGSNSSDTDGTIVSYEWFSADTLLASGSEVDVDLSVGVHTISLKVTDDDDATSTDTVIITIEAANVLPIADAGADQTVTDKDNTGLETISLDGSNSSDTDGTIVSYEWFSADTLLASGSEVNVDLSVGVHTISLKVTDDKGSFDTDTVIITINEYVGINSNITNIISIYPNPTTEGIHINISGINEQVTVIVTNITGKVVINSEMLLDKDNYLNLQELNSGTYIISVLNNAKLIDTKILIVK